jgi:hypothetical protein
MDGKEWKFGKQVSISGLDQRVGAKNIGYLGNGVQNFWKMRQKG